jgi:hypothetical protein
MLEARPACPSWPRSGRQLPSAVAAVMAATVGAVVAVRRPRHPAGWLLQTMGPSLTLASASSSYKWYGLVAQPGSMPGVSYLAGLTNGVNIVYVACAGFVLLLSPWTA